MWLILFFSFCLYFFHPSAFTYIGRSRPTAAARQAIRPAPLIYSVRKERKKQFLTEAILRAAVKLLAAPAQAVAAGLSAFTARMELIDRKKARGNSAAPVVLSGFLARVHCRGFPTTLCSVYMVK